MSSHRSTPVCQNTSAYNNFAHLYQKYWDSSYQTSFLQVIDELVPSAARPGTSVLDLCCGTGGLAGLLSRRGCRVTGLDLAEAMIGLARKSAPTADFVVADARCFAFREAFDAVVSTADSLNHVTKIEELAHVFRNVRAALVPNGPFLFDLLMESAFSSEWPPPLSIVEDDRVLLLNAFYDRPARLGGWNVTSFRQSTLSGAWTRADSVIYQKCYREDEIRAALLDCGFTQTRTFSGADEVQSAGALAPGRMFVVAR